MIKPLLALVAVLCVLPAFAQATGVTLVGAGYYTDPPDATPPEAISNLTTNSPATSTCGLTWSAPHEDSGSGGAVQAYDCRACLVSTCSTTMSDGEYSSATQLTGEPAPPASPTTTENMTATGLTSGVSYVFGCKSVDDQANPSALSNSATCTTTSAANLFAETFDANPGYDGTECGTQPGCWGESGDNGSTILVDEDATVSSSVVNGVTGFSGQALRMVANTDGAQPMTIYELSADETGDVYCGVNLYVDVEALADNQTATLIKMDDNTAPGTPQGFGSSDGAAVIQLRKITGQLELVFKTGSGSVQYTENISIGVGYRVEWRVNPSGFDTELRVNGNTIDIPTDAVNPSHNVERIRIGVAGPDTFPTRVFYDRFSCGTSTWIGS